MMNPQTCVAMLLAGGEGRRLSVLTRQKAKPAVQFGGAYRIIDFALSNCRNSGLSAVGVITQYKSESLHNHIGCGAAWLPEGGVTLLPSTQRHIRKSGYSGTADAVYQNIPYIETYEPEHVLILSGDHIYRMDYRKLLEEHQRSGADVTIAVTPVSTGEASRFGIMRTNDSGRVIEFEEKPAQPRGNLASMGIYMFRWSALRAWLKADAMAIGTSHDFGKDLIPAMLNSGARMHTYSFQGYWRDVGTVESLWDAHMDLLGRKPLFGFHDPAWPILTPLRTVNQTYVDPSAQVTQSLISGNCTIHGQVERSVISSGVEIGAGSQLQGCVVMPNARIGRNVTIRGAIIGEGAVIEDGADVERLTDLPVAVVGDREIVRRKHELLPKLYMPVQGFTFEPIG
ncbi:glucose-1-phosphate adenylyltransferase [Paenibacillus silviterrae]|uniref:glucose-1-phosphate adenylyltransferase n=1 Tax=Paenibacillus silviterrae TaxID=3242194 RepID=UPI002543B487|nr:glucose-1-phosphate adenylyltransferase [Paenibacillus chinjuensis]